ncbi:hypothetical protein Ms3S1_16190 [Methylosinus sp. 3S-1]
MLGHKEKKALFTAVIRGVQCEIRRAVIEQLDDPVYGGRVAWLKDWSALINLQLTFDEALAFNPGVTLKTPNLPDAIVWRADGTTRTLPQLYSEWEDASTAIGAVRKRSSIFILSTISGIVTKERIESFPAITRNHSTSWAT